MRARAMAIWAAMFVGVLPFGALLTGGLTALFGSGTAVAIDGGLMLLGGLVVLALRPEIRWLGCAALPEACIAATSPEAVAVRESGSRPQIAATDPAHVAARGRLPGRRGGRCRSGRRCFVFGHVAGLHVRLGDRVGLVALVRSS